MRFVQVAVPAGKQADVTSALNEDDINYAITEASGDDGYDAVISFPLSQDAVESTLDRLREDGLTDDAWTVVLDAQTVVSEGPDVSERKTTTKTHPGAASPARNSGRRP